MGEFNTARGSKALGGLITLSALALGCSSAATDETASAPAITDPGVSPDMILRTSATLIPATPIPSYCVANAALVPVRYPAHYAIKLPNTWGSPYGDNSGYSIPFPTPWITSGQEASYETALSHIPYTNKWEYLVRLVTTTTSGRSYTEDLTRAYFLVGTTAQSSYAAESSLAQSFQASPTEAQANICVRILTESNGYVYDTGEWFIVYETHDPRPPATRT
jgi:hypothetical protein